jgi:hypothetical protein
MISVQLTDIATLSKYRTALVLNAVALSAIAATGGPGILRYSTHVA